MAIWEAYYRECETSLPGHLARSGRQGSAVSALLDNIATTPWLQADGSRNAEAVALAEHHLRAVGIDLPVTIMRHQTMREIVADPPGSISDRYSAALADAVETWRGRADRLDPDAVETVTTVISRRVCRVLDTGPDYQHRNASLGAARDFRRAALRLLAEPCAGPDPMAPLVDLWRLGHYPIGVCHGEYIVLAPRMPAHDRAEEDLT